mmetsp:Transcript_15800/g.28684  ORF Transcript_15800/g.28684 Transcript_15800/m.28684 type:complete len:121 (+) Transcript_15800:184-546(+)
MSPTLALYLIFNHVIYDINFFFATDNIPIICLQPNPVQLHNSSWRQHQYQPPFEPPFASTATPCSAVASIWMPPKDSAAPQDCSDGYYCDCGFVDRLGDTLHQHLNLDILHSQEIENVFG